MGAGGKVFRRFYFGGDYGKEQVDYSVFLPELRI